LCHPLQGRVLQLAAAKTRRFEFRGDLNPIRILIPGAGDAMDCGRTG
jgi:hypothetical protein